MPPVDFKLKPLPGSRFYCRVRIFPSRVLMELQARRDGSVSGSCEAAHCGLCGVLPSPKIGDIYLYRHAGTHGDAVHEIGHAAVHYVREIRKGDLAITNSGEDASFAEELLCRVLEHYLVGFNRQLGRCAIRRARAYSLKNHP